MYPVNYHRPKTLLEASTLLESCEDPKLLAGGQTLIPTMKQRLAAPTDLIDLRHIAELTGISTVEGGVLIGAITSHGLVASSKDVIREIPALAYLASKIGDPMVRNMGTIGGSISNNDPTADYPAALLGLDAIVNTNKKSLAASDFFVDLFETALDEDEIVVSIFFPRPEKSGYIKFANPASGYATVGVFLAKIADGTARVSITGAGDSGVFRYEEAEKALNTDWSEVMLRDLKPDVDSLMSDLHAQADYRAHLITVLLHDLVVRLK